MTTARIVGIDWATEAKNRAAVVLSLDDSTPHVMVQEIICPLPESSVISLCQDTGNSVVGVDIPFGWPRKFTEFIGSWTPVGGAELKCPERWDYRYRATDLFVHRLLQKWPLSVTSDRIALGARLWTKLCQDGKLSGRIDVCGNPFTGNSPTIIEVYPAATLLALASGGLPVVAVGYKADSTIRQKLVEALLETFGITFADGMTLAGIVGDGKDSDRTDALIAAVTAAIYHLDRKESLRTDSHHTSLPLNSWTVCFPGADQLDDARKEGWIFFPTQRGH